MIRGFAGTLLWTCLAGCVGVGLFLVKHEVKDLEGRLADVNRDIQRNQEEIHVLRAEWAFLNDPGRLRDLSERHLGMKPVNAGQVVASLDGLDAASQPAFTAALPADAIRPVAAVAVAAPAAGAAAAAKPKLAAAESHPAPAKTAHTPAPRPVPGKPAGGHQLASAAPHAPSLPVVAAHGAAAPSAPVHGAPIHGAPVRRLAVAGDLVGVNGEGR